MSNLEADLEAYRQAHDTLRHYSGLRFIVLGAFTVATGGVFAYAWQNFQQDPGARRAASLFFILASLVFAGVEYRINEIAGFQREKILSLSKQLGMSEAACQLPPMSFLARWIAPAAMLMIYGGSIAMWAYALFR